MINALTVDVEDYFQVASFEKIIRFSDWEGFDSHVCQNTKRLLDIFDEYQVSATFFVLGWVAQKFPELIGLIRDHGHEVACHGLRHTRINLQTPASFREDIRLAKTVIEQCIGETITGYRAASFSIYSDTLWALEILIEEGFKYDSSIFPITHDRYGMPTAPRFPYRVSTASGTLIEFPLTTVRHFGRNIPAAGGGYFRLLPYSFTRSSIKQINQQEGLPAIFYLHPWEIDSKQPRQKAGWSNRIRHYTNIERTEQHLRWLLNEFRFASISDVLRGCPLRTFEIGQKGHTRPSLMAVGENISFFDNIVPGFRTKMISVVLPVYNEAPNLELLCKELGQALRPLDLQSEWIFVDDGSTDESFARLQLLKKDYPEIKIVKLRRNFGQTAAMQAGFDVVRGDAVVSMDADLQNDPHDIPLLLTRLEKGFDLVCGWRKNRKDPWLSRRLPSKIANKLIQKVCGGSIHDRGCSLKMYRSDLVKAFQLYSDMHRFIEEVSTMTGARISELSVNHRARKYGTSKYGISRTLSVLSDVCALKLITRFSLKPAVGFFLIALPFSAVGSTVLALAVGFRLIGPSHNLGVIDFGVAVLSLATFCFLILLGLIGEMAVHSARHSFGRSGRMMFEERKENDSDD